MVSLHFLKSKTIAAANKTKLKAACKEHCIPVPKTASKDDLLRSLGQVLFEKNIVQRKDETKVISYENLKCNNAK